MSFSATAVSRVSAIALHARALGEQTGGNS